MSETEESTGVGPVKKKGKKRLVAFLLLIGLFGVGSAGAYLYVLKGSSASADATEPPAEEKPSFGPLVELHPIVTNLNDPDAGRYIKVVVHLEAKDPEAAAEIENALIPIRDRLLVYFGDVRVADTVGEERKDEIRAHLVETVNELLGADQVQNLYFSEFVIQ